MIKLRLLLPLLATVTLSGCMTTERMPDGTTKIRISDDAAKSLASLMPGGVVTGLSGSGGSGQLDLNPTQSPLKTSEWLYFNGQHDFECATAFMYAAKTAKQMDAQLDGDCRDRYLQRQQLLKRAGKTYDRSAPMADPTNPPEAYWRSLSGRLISQLAAIDSFPARFGSLPQQDRYGRYTIKANFLGAVMGQPVALATIPALIPVTIDDAGFEAKMRAESSRLNTNGGGWVSCSSVLVFDSAVDKGRRPAKISSSEYSRYEVRFKVASMGCKDAIHQYKAVAVSKPSAQ